MVRHRLELPLRELARLGGERLMPCSDAERPGIIELARKIGEELGRDTQAVKSGSAVLVTYGVRR